MMKKSSQLDRIFESGIANVSRVPQAPLSDEQIAATAKASKSGAAVWMRMHAKELLLCAIFLAFGVAGTLLVARFTGKQGSATEPVETVAAVVCDTAMVANDTDVLSDGPATKTNTEPTASTVEALRATPLQAEQSVATSVKPNNRPTASAVETQRAASLPIDRSATASVKPISNSSNLESQAPSPVVVKKTIVQRDTIVINETVTVKDTVYLMEN